MQQQPASVKSFVLPSEAPIKASSSDRVAVRASHPYIASEPDDISFAAGDEIIVTKASNKPDGWWQGNACTLEWLMSSRRSMSLARPLTNHFQTINQHGPSPWSPLCLLHYMHATSLTLLCWQ